MGDRSAVVVHGTSWRRHGRRRQHAARIARLLRPVVEVAGGVVSTELVAPVGGCWHRPDVGVVLGDDVPHDGVLASAPSVVVRLGGPLTCRDWLLAGAAAVWSWDPGSGAVEEATRGGTRRWTAGQRLVHPHDPSVRLDVARVAVGPPPGTRISA